MSSPSFKNMYIEKCNKIGSGGFSQVYKVLIRPLESFNPLQYLEPKTPKQEQPVIKESLTECSRQRKPKIGALKYIEASSYYGLDSLMEAYIMRNIKDPNINRAWGIELEANGAVSIIQSLALGDASTIVKKRKHNVSKLKLTEWLWRICVAVAQLHIRGIIHGDIKSGNILVFSESNVKELPNDINDSQFFESTIVRLNDFSLSRLIMNPDEGTRDNPKTYSYTSTHRAIEVWKGLNFSFPADIWALGCTFYELVYKNNLFQEQNTVPKNMEPEANYLAFEEWGSRDFKMETDEKHGSPVPQNNVFQAEATSRYSDGKNEVFQYEFPQSSFLRYKHCNIVPEYNNPENALINNLICGMLEIDPNIRLNIWDIFNHEYFEPMRQNTLMVSLIPEYYPIRQINISYPYENVPKQVIDEIKLITDDDHIIQLAISIYQRCVASIRACAIVASKLIYRIPPPQFGTVGISYLSEEIDICRRLNFNFLPHSF